MLGIATTDEAACSIFLISHFTYEICEGKRTVVESVRAGLVKLEGGGDDQPGGEGATSKLAPEQP